MKLSILQLKNCLLHERVFVMRIFTETLNTTHEYKPYAVA